MLQQVYIGLGSNLGDRVEFLEKAAHALAPAVIPLRSSSIYQTPPWGYAEQPSFLNQVIQAQTDLKPEDLLKKLKQIEKDLGRVEIFRYGPRCIDLDILLYDDLVYQSDTLVVPHPQLAGRAFVLVPLNEIAPNLVHPVLKVKISELLKKLEHDQIELFNGVEKA